MTNIFDLKIDNLAYGGDAVGRLPDGRVVFVPYAIPGEMARVRLIEEKPRHARAELLDVLEHSPERVVPRCQHFGTCGGCHYQHMSYPWQLSAKLGILRGQLERIGGLKDIPEIESVAAPEPWNYRNHIQFHLTREGKLGFQRAHSNQTFAIRECHLPEAVINLVWPQVEIEPMPGLERVSLRVGAGDDVMLILESTDPLPVEFNIEDLPVSVVQTGPSGNLVLAGSNYILMEVLDKRFQVSAGSFFQVNTSQADAMVRQIHDRLPINQDMTILDIYSGVGLFSAFLAPQVKRLVGIEISPQACEDFTTNLDEFDNVELYEAPAEEVLVNVDFKPDVIVMDPPRAGMGAKTIQGILNQGATYMAYVSCDPATLSRDARQLASGGYSLIGVTLLDMFPQTFHIESISFWEKKR